MGKSIVTMEEQGRRGSHPLIVTMSFQPVIPQRVARQQSPPPLVKAAKTLKAHLRNILTYFRHRLTNATAEGLNSKIQMVKEMACGFRNREHYKTAIYFHCDGLDLYSRAGAAA